MVLRNSEVPARRSFFFLESILTLRICIFLPNPGLRPSEVLRGGVSPNVGYDRAGGGGGLFRGWILLRLADARRSGWARHLEPKLALLPLSFFR